mmetsp:Transcript_31900/g.96458  ORF Transcript_31900/g.96458 Transcript_31900/m.96458 type:complete len:268 (-) Transcript_31900:1136-1939(-)
MLQALELLPVLVGGLAQQTLKVVHTLLQRGVARVAHLLLRREQAPHVRLVRRAVLGQPRVELVALGMRGPHLPRVLIGVVRQGGLHLLRLLGHRRMVRVASLLLGGDPRVRGLDRVELLGVLVPVLGEHVVQLLHVPANGLVLRRERGLAASDVRVRLLEVADGARAALARSESIVQRVDFRVRRRQLPRVLVGGVARQPLEVLQPLVHRAVVGLAGGLVLREAGVRSLERVDRHAVRLAVREPPVEQVHLPLGLHECLRVLVGGIT